MAKTKPKAAAPWVVTWSGSGGAKLGIEITNPGKRAQVLPVIVGVAGGDVFVSKLSELAPGKNRREALSGSVLVSCFSGTPDIRLEPGAYSLSVAVGKADLEPLRFAVRDGGSYPLGPEPDE